MSLRNVKNLPALFALVLATSANAGEKIQVEIIDRRESSSVYSYSVPGTTTANTYGNANCSTYGSYTNCGTNSTTTFHTSPGHQGEYEVRGATFSLRLPDGRIAVVNCERKVNWTEFSPNWYRSCRQPLVNTIQAEFSGDKAKLRWPVSLDGRKFETETYKILAVLPAPIPPQ
jgi:hypothetical protein